eukprot:80125_1
MSNNNNRRIHVKNSKNTKPSSCDDLLGKEMTRDTCLFAEKAAYLINSTVFKVGRSDMLLAALSIDRETLLAAKIEMLRLFFRSNAASLKALLYGSMKAMKIQAMRMTGTVQYVHPIVQKYVSEVDEYVKKVTTPLPKRISTLMPHQIDILYRAANKVLHVEMEPQIETIVTTYCLLEFYGHTTSITDEIFTKHLNCLTEYNFRWKNLSMKAIRAWLRSASMYDCDEKTHDDHLSIDSDQNELVPAIKPAQLAMILPAPHRPTRQSMNQPLPFPKLPLPNCAKATTNPDDDCAMQHKQNVMVRPTNGDMMYHAKNGMSREWSGNGNNVDWRLQANPDASQLRSDDWGLHYGGYRGANTNKNGHW